MIKAGIQDVKNNLSRYIAQVRTGKEILITNRGRPVAGIVKEHRGNKRLRTAHRSLTEKGVVVMPICFSCMRSRICFGTLQDPPDIPEKIQIRFDVCS